jgi:hypothetical protein
MGLPRKNETLDEHNARRRGKTRQLKLGLPVPPRRVGSDPETYKRNQRLYQLRQFGLTQDKYDALWMAQRGRCGGCGRVMLPWGHQSESVTVDHDHRCCPGNKSCGKCVRGLLCRNCNITNGLQKDDPARLRGLAAYLENWNAVELSLPGVA